MTQRTESYTNEYNATALRKQPDLINCEAAPSLLPGASLVHNAYLMMTLIVKAEGVLLK